MITQDLMSPLTELTGPMREFLPRVFSALLLVGAGWVLGATVRIVSRKLLATGMARLQKRAGLGRALEHTGARARIPGVVGGFLFWAVLLFFVAAAVEALGLAIFTSSVQQIAHYLPNVLAAILIVFAGIVGGNLVNGMVVAAAERTGWEQGAVLGTIAQVSVVLVVGLVAMEQVGIAGNVVVTILAVVVGGLLATAGLAFGLGARVAVGNLVASHYVTQSYRVGETVSIDGVEGPIARITATAVVIETGQGLTSLPAQRFLEVMSTLVSGSPRQSDPS